MKDDYGNDLFKRSNYDYDELTDAVSLYRKVLSNQIDQSVIIISVGFSTNLVRLLNSKPDQYSKLIGIDLINKKVKLLSVMAGSFGSNAIPEYNIIKDIPAAKALVEYWPTQIVFSPYEAGITVLYPSKSIENHFCWTKGHPLVEAYKYYLEMPYNRPTWDLIAILYAIENSKIYFTQSEWGTISVDNNGFTNFKKNKKGKHAYLTINKTQAKETLTRFMQLITRIPKSQFFN